MAQVAVGAKIEKRLLFTVCEGYIFTPVCHVHRGCLPKCKHTPWQQTPPGKQTPCEADPPLCSACWEIRATSTHLTLMHTCCADVCSSKNSVENGEKQPLQWLFAYFQHFSLKFKLGLWSCVSCLIGVIVCCVSRKIGSWAVSWKKPKDFVVIAIAIAMAWISTHPGSIWNIYGKLKRD